MVSIKLGKRKVSAPIQCKFILAAESKIESRRDDIKEITKKSFKEKVKAKLGTETVSFVQPQKDRKRLLKIAKSDICEDSNATVQITCSEANTAEQDLIFGTSGEGPREGTFQKEALNEFSKISKDFECLRISGGLKRSR